MTVHPRRVIIRYYRLRAINPDTTLKAVCDRMGANYQTVRNYKVRYDAARKRAKHAQRDDDSSDRSDRNR